MEVISNFSVLQQRVEKYKNQKQQLNIAGLILAVAVLIVGFLFPNAVIGIVLCVLIAAYATVLVMNRINVRSVLNAIGAISGAEQSDAHSFLRREYPKEKVTVGLPDPNVELLDSVD